MRMCLSPEPAMYGSPAASMAAPKGQFNEALGASPPSLAKGPALLPVTVVTMAGARPTGKARAKAKKRKPRARPVWQFIAIPPMSAGAEPTWGRRFRATKLALAP